MRRTGILAVNYLMEVFRIFNVCGLQNVYCLKKRYKDIIWRGNDNEELILGIVDIWLILAALTG